MNSSTTDKLKGTAKEVAGKVNEETGKAMEIPICGTVARQKRSPAKWRGKAER
jgi:hypothetical protein